MRGNNADDQYKKFDAPPLPKASVAPTPPVPAAATQASRPVKKLSPEQKQNIIARYRAREHTDEIIRDYGISSTTLYNVLHAAGVPLRTARPASGKPHVDAPTLAPQAAVAKQLELAIKRIDLAGANAAADRECAVWALRSATDILQVALDKLETGQKHDDG
jgi:transposase-like protein